MLYLFIYTRCTYDSAQEMTGHSRHTICDWWNMYHRGRLLCFNKRIAEEGPTKIALEAELRAAATVIPDWNQEVPDPDDVEPNPNPKRNYGNRVVGPREVGIYQNHSKVRFFVVEDRTASTLIDIIQRTVTPNSVIVSYEWKGYLPLSSHGFTHYTVNHSKNYVNPVTGKHTQGIERAWVDGKAFLKRTRRPNNQFQSHLNEISYRKLYKDDKNLLI